MGAGGTLLGDVFRALSMSTELERISRRRSLLLSCVGDGGKYEVGHGARRSSQFRGETRGKTSSEAERRNGREGTLQATVRHVCGDRGGDEEAV